MHFDANSFAHQVDSIFKGYDVAEHTSDFDGKCTHTIRAYPINYGPHTESVIMREFIVDHEPADKMDCMRVLYFGLQRIASDIKGQPLKQHTLVSYLEKLL